MYIGSFITTDTVHFHFNTWDATGAPITLAGTPSLTVYKDGSLWEKLARPQYILSCLLTRAHLHQFRTTRPNRTTGACQPVTWQTADKE